MIYKDITKIPYTFLRNAVQEISKKYNVCSVKLDPVGEVYVLRLKVNWRRKIETLL